MKRHLSLGMMALILIGLSTGAGAQSRSSNDDEEIRRWHINFGFSRNHTSIPQQTIDAYGAFLAAAQPTTPGFTITDTEDNPTGIKFLLGYDFSPFLAVEVGTASFGTSNVEYDFRLGLNSIGAFKIDYKMDALFADVVGTLPLGAGWSVLARGGLSAGRTRIAFNGSPVSVISSNNDQEKTKTRAKFGAGAQYDFTSRAAIRVEWERYKLPDPLNTDKLVEIDAFTASVLYRF